MTRPLFEFETVPDKLSDQSSIQLNRKSACDLGLLNRKFIILRFGLNQEYVAVHIHTLIPDNMIRIGHLGVKQLGLITGLKYQLNLSGSNLVVGPVIGLMMRHTEVQLVRELDSVIRYLTLQPLVCGLVYVFATDQINFEERSVCGYIYSPDNPSLHLKRKTLPFPKIWYRRVGFKDGEDYRKTRQLMGRNMVNGYYFTKWEFWKWLKDDLQASPHMAQTSIHVNIDTLNDYLTKFGAAYIKPRMGYGGQGVECVSRMGNTYIFKRNFKDTIEISEESIREHLGTYRRHIIQQPIDILRFEGRQVTYRAIVQRDAFQFWKLTGLVGFFGGVNEITGNWSKNGGYLRPGHDALKRQYHGDIALAYRAKYEIERVCIEMANAISRNIDEYVDFGMDIGIDTSGKVWVVEVNKRQHYETCEHVGEIQLHLASMANNLLACSEMSMNELDS